MEFEMPNILVATLGTWALIPEVLGFTNPGLVDLYRNHPHAENLVASRERNGIHPVSEVWIITTGGDFAEGNLSELKEWYELLSENPVRPLMKIWKVMAIDDLSSARECRIMGEAIMRLCLAASEAVTGGKCYHSLAGGRKTMSTDLQRAAFVFGSHGLLHVIQNLNPSKSKDQFKAGNLAAPLPPGYKDYITPLFVGSSKPDPVVELSDESSGPIKSCNFPVPEAGDVPADFHLEKDTLTLEIEERLSRSSFLLCNYSARISSEETSPGFMALYGLSPDLIKNLKTIHIGLDPDKKEPEINWLKMLPKAELHCHLGGIADARGMIEIAEANAPRIECYRGIIDPWLDTWQRRLDRGEFPRDLKALRKQNPSVPEPLSIAAFLLLFRDAPETLDRLLFGDLTSEKDFVGIGFEPYEQLGDLQGSALLQSPESLRAASRILIRDSLEHNVRYLETRCSPAKYTKGGMAPLEVASIVAKMFTGIEKLHHGLLFIASRHEDLREIDEHVNLASKMIEDPKGVTPPRGFDVAGRESSRSASDLRKYLLPLMERCLHLTIHAGETERVESIWQAVYHLNAERIGHGLTLREKALLMERFKDRGIAIEMCPSSNTQIIGFRDNYLPETKNLSIYPLKKYLEYGLRVCIGTDNPGISRTNPTSELHRAARLTPGGLSLWEVLVLVRNGFKASFAERDLRHRLIRNAEKEIIQMLQEGGIPSG
jgi:adenosine deaminase